MNILILRKYQNIINMCHLKMQYELMLWCAVSLSMCFYWIIWDAVISKKSLHTQHIFDLIWFHFVHMEGSMRDKKTLSTITLSGSYWTDRKPHTLTQAVETEGAIVEEEADVACPHWHAAEGVSTARCQRINAAGEQEDQQRPGEGVLPCCLNQHHRH